AWRRQREDLPVRRMHAAAALGLARFAWPAAPATGGDGERAIPGKGPVFRRDGLAALAASFPGELAILGKAALARRHADTPLAGDLPLHALVHARKPASLALPSVSRHVCALR